MLNPPLFGIILAEKSRKLRQIIFMRLFWAQNGRWEELVLLLQPDGWVSDWYRRSR